MANIGQLTFVSILRQVYCEDFKTLHCRVCVMCWRRIFEHQCGQCYQNNARDISKWWGIIAGTLSVLSTVCSAIVNVTFVQRPVHDFEIHLRE